MNVRDDNEPAGWLDEPDEPPSLRRKRPPRRAGITTYLAIALLLVVLVAGGGYLALVEGWIDLDGNAPAGETVARTASSPAAHPVFSGNAHDLVAAPGNLVQQDGSNASVTWIRSSVREASAAGATDAASLQIKPELAANLVGKLVEVTVSARAPDQGTPQPFAVAFSSANVGSSGWVVFTPTKEFQDYAFTYRVPATVAQAQYVGIWSDISGRSTPLAVRSIAIRPLS